MSEDGYTLAEMLAALLMIGLAMAGLTQAMRVLGLFQGSTTRLEGQQRAIRIAELDLANLMDGQGPFRSTEPTFRGDPTAFQFDCGRPKPCGARLEVETSAVRIVTSNDRGDEQAALLPDGADGHFIYVGDKAALNRWPPAGERQTLKAINLVQGSGQAPLLTARLWVEQGADCAFDAIAQDCREAAQ